jgi:hypothetical protein
MDIKQQLHELRVRFIELNMEYTKRVRNGEEFGELQFMNDELNELIGKIQELEREEGKEVRGDGES